MTKIVISDENIAANIGNIWNPNCCPIATEVRRLIGKDHIILVSYNALYIDEHLITLPQEASDWQLNNMSFAHESYRENHELPTGLEFEIPIDEFLI